MSRKPLTRDYVLQHLNYDPDTGVFTATGLKRPSFTGRRVGSFNEKVGYEYWHHGGTSYLLHRLAWLIVTGEWPEHEVDHINRDRRDQRWSNLRAATRQDNMCNLIRASSLGVKGVYKRGERYIAQITRDRKPMYLGSYATIEEAQVAYALVADALHGEYARVA